MNNIRLLQQRRYRVEAITNVYLSIYLSAYMYIPVMDSNRLHNQLGTQGICRQAVPGK